MDDRENLGAEKFKSWATQISPGLEVFHPLIWSARKILLPDAFIARPPYVADQSAPTEFMPTVVHVCPPSFDSQTFPCHAASTITERSAFVASAAAFELQPELSCEKELPAFIDSHVSENAFVAIIRVPSVLTARFWY